MKVKAIIPERFEDYKLPTMYIGCVNCSGKCAKEGGFSFSECINNQWTQREAYEIEDKEIIEKYLANPITSAITFGLLEPFDQFAELLTFIQTFRTTYLCTDSIIIYTGYYPHELLPQLKILKQYPNIIIKFGRYIPNDTSHYDPVLGVNLASSNQYALLLDDMDLLTLKGE